MYKLSDFGYAKEAESNKLQSIVGTLPYAVSEALAADDCVCHLSAYMHIPLLCVCILVCKHVVSEIRTYTYLTVLASFTTHTHTHYVCIHAYLYNLCFDTRFPASPQAPEVLRVSNRHYRRSVSAITGFMSAFLQKLQN